MLSRGVVVLVMAVMISAASLLVAGCSLSNGGGPTSSSAVVTSSSSTTPGTSSTGTSTPGASSTSSTSTSGSSTTAPSSTTTSAPPVPAKDYTRLPTDEKVVALTFDAAYDPEPLAAILDALEAADATGTFFLTGEFVRDFPAETKEIIAAGYPIGNHSYSHPDFTEISDAEIRDQLRRTAAAIEKAGAPDPRPLFRAPYGALDKHVLSVVGSEGYVSIFWTIDTLDWKTERTTAQIKATVLDKLQPGAIVLMHVGSRQTAEVLPEILQGIEARGYRFVNLRDALPAP